MSDMAKRTSTLSVRCTAELEDKLTAIAMANGTSLSSLINEQLEHLAEREHRRYQQLKRAFEINEGLPAHSVPSRSVETRTKED